MISCVFFFCPQRPINFIIIPQVSGDGSQGPCWQGWTGGGQFLKNRAIQSGRDCRSVQGDPRGGWLWFNCCNNPETGPSVSGCHERNECFPASWLICRSRCNSGRSPEILRLFTDPSLLSTAIPQWVKCVQCVGKKVANRAMACIPRAI